MKTIRTLLIVVPVPLLGAGFLSPHLPDFVAAHPVPTGLIAFLVFLVGIAISQRISARAGAPGPRELADGFVRFDVTGPARPRFCWERLVNAVDVRRPNYHVHLTPRDTMPLKEVIRFYKEFAGRPVYLHRDIAHLGIGSIRVSARTRLGLVRALERRLARYGVICTPSLEGAAVVMTGALQHAAAPAPQHPSSQAIARHSIEPGYAAGLAEADA